MDHSLTRSSFEAQTGLFSGPDALFGQSLLWLRDWLEPLAPDAIALDVACGAAHVAQEIASRVRQVVGIDLTPALLDLAAARLAAAGTGTSCSSRATPPRCPSPTAPSTSSCAAQRCTTSPTRPCSSRKWHACAVPAAGLPSPTCSPPTLPAGRRSTPCTA